MEMYKTALHISYLVFQKSPSDLTIDIKEEPPDDVEPAPPGMD